MVCCSYWHQPAVFCRFWQHVLALNCGVCSFVAVLSGGVLIRVWVYELCHSFVCALYWVSGRSPEIVLKQLLPVRAQLPGYQRS